MRRFVIGWRKVRGLESPHADQMQALLEAMANAGLDVTYRQAPSERVQVYQGRELLAVVRYRRSPPDPASELAPGGQLAADTLDAIAASSLQVRTKAKEARARLLEIAQGEGEPISRIESDNLMRRLAQLLVKEDQDR